VPAPEVKLFEPEGSAEGCASGECLPAAAEVPEPEEAEVPPLPVEAALVSDDEKWRKAVEALRTASPRHGKSLSYAHFLGLTPEGVRVAFGPDAAFHRAQVLGASRGFVETELTRAMKRPVKLLEETNVQALENAPKTIAQVEANDRSARERSIEDKVKSHPALRSILKHLGGSVEHITYLEPEPSPALTSATSDDSDGSPPVE
jgi:hypothetical protein